jgi:serine/threonine-protein kinase
MTARETLGHYEILGPIGAGGMGEVYVARDPKLGRKVAIKLLPSRLNMERETLTRFTQEARSASALNHPNIVTIHEVGAADGRPYIVMEYIEGTDLRTLITEGPVPVRKVLEIGAQIADGLAAAHERGIVHRDLKPENIMLTRDGYAKILDFGLAKIVAPTPEGTDDTLQLEMPGTNPGTILGTVGYMSPEQATGRRLDFRSDQFAFGAILHELITGRPAFEGETAIDTLSAILHHDPEPVTRSNPRAPVQLADMIRRLMDKNVDDRYASSRDLARELRLLRDRVVAEESGFHQSPSTDGPRKSIIATAAAIVLAGGIAATVYLTRQPTPNSVVGTPRGAAPAVAKKYLAVMRFNDLTGDATGQLVVDGFAETLTARLSHYTTVQVMRPPAADETTDARVTARNLGANLVLTGSMMRNADRIRVTYSVLEPHSGREWRDLIEGNIANLFGIQDDVAESVARNLSLGESSARAALDPAVSQRRYLEALGHLRRYDLEESVDHALAILKELGPSPSVQAALARAYLAKFQLTNEPEWAAAAGTAADAALKADPQSIDVNVTLGELRRHTGRHQEAVAAFMLVLPQQPNNADAVLGLAETYKAAGDIRNAENAYKQAIALQPNFWGGYNKLGAFYYGQGRYADAVPQFQKVVQLVPDNQRGYNNLGGMYQKMGRYEEAVRVFAASIQRAPTAQAYSNLGTCYYFTGRPAEAAQAFEKAVALRPHYFLYRRNLGDAYRWIPGQEVRAQAAFREAVKACDDALRVNPSESSAHSSRAVALAKLGDRAGARKSILRALEIDGRNSSRAYDAAVVANTAGAEDDAIARLEQAIRLGYSSADILRDPEFANLRKNGRLQTIIAGAGSIPTQHN